MKPSSRLLDRVFPGATPQAFALVMGAAALLCVYYACAWKYFVPAAFAELCASIGFSGSTAARQLWSHLLALWWLLLVPLLAMRFWQKTSATELGLGLGSARREWLWVLGLYLLIFPVLLLVSQLAPFQRTYPRLAAVETDATLFLAYHLIYLCKWVSWEFFFRGFLLFGLWKHWRGNAVAVSTLAFALLHIPKPSLELYGALLAGPALCFLALRGKTIWPGVVLHWATALTMDFLGCTFWR